MRTVLRTFVLLVLPVTAVAQNALPVGSIAVSTPQAIAKLDMGKLKGEPSRMAWSPDHSQIYLQTIEGAFHQPKAIRHYVIDARNGKVKSLEAEPEWFAAYWSVKSDKASPDTPGLAIGLETEQRREKTTSTPMGGDLARGGADIGTGASSAGELNAAATSQNVTVHTMKLHGRPIGEFINSVIVPGLTFAWAPKGSKAIAYTEPKGGQLVVMSADGKRQELDGTKDALLPMWSADAGRLAWLQKDGRNKFELKVAEIR